MKKAILVGDYADPSIIRVDKDYYMVTSTYKYAPIFTIWHSVNLLDWEPLCNALDGFYGDVWAPDLVHYDGKFYIYFPSNKTNYVIWADKIEGPWSEPIDLKIKHIDPGHCFDDEGNRYLYMSQGMMVPLAKDGLSVLGELKEVYKPWKIPEEWEVECTAQEAPKIIKKGEYYYIFNAQGGTSGPATSHMEVVARSKSVKGPWEYCPNNPIIHTYSKSEPWWSKGHAAIVDTPEGDWYIVYHAYKNGMRTLGRHVLISKIIWTDDGWLRVEEIEDYNKPRKNTEFLKLSDDFKCDKFNVNWKLYDSGAFERFTFTKNGLEMQGYGTSISETNPLLVIPYSDSYELTTKVTLDTDTAEGGLTLFQSQYAYAYVGIKKGKIVSGTMRQPKSTIISEDIKTVYLKILNNCEIVTFFYSFDNVTWQKLIPTIDVSGFNHNTFMGSNLRAGIYTLGEGKAKFEYFNYRHIK